MKDISEIIVLDESFELSEAIANNYQLQKTNKQLTYLVLGVSLLFVGAILFIANNKPPKDPAKKKS